MATGSIKYADLIEETTSSSGTGDLTLGGATGGRRAFSSGYSDADRTVVMIDDGGGNFERCEAIFNSGTPSITRGYVFESSNSNARVTFASGSKTIRVDFPPKTAQALEIVRRNTLFNAAQIAKATGIAAYIRGEKYFADGFAGSDGIKSASSSNYTVDTTNKLVKPSPSQTAISQGAGTTIGSMSFLANGFDGNNATNVTCGGAASTNGFNNTVGKDWGLGNSHSVTRFTVRGPSGGDFLTGGGATTLKLQGSTNNSSWNDLCTAQNTTAGAGFTVDVSGATITDTTAYRYHRININGNGVNEAECSEINFYETVGVNNMTVVAVAQIPDSNPIRGRVGLIVQPVDALTLNTDLLAYLSADNESNYVQGTLRQVAKLTKGAGSDVYRYETDTIDLSAHTGTSGIISKIVSANTKSFYILGSVFEWDSA